MNKKLLVLGLLSGLIIVGVSRSARAGDDWGDEPQKKSSYPYPVPLGLEAPKVPKNNPITKAKVELGKLLYFDKRLSQNKMVSCATCHSPAKGWTDQLPVSTGINGHKGTRSSPPVFNSAYNAQQFWDGRAPSLEEQAKGPIQNPVEMGFTLTGVQKRIAKIKAYREFFKNAFGSDKVTIDRVVQAIASFERTILAGNSAYDRFRAGDKKAISASAQRGMNLFFGRANCDACHSGPNFSDSQYHNLGVGLNSKKPDLGRFLATKRDSDKGKFKTPTLRGLLYTQPYMHDGSEKTLSQVVDFYDKGGTPNPHLDKEMHPLQLTHQEKRDLVAFLESLHGAPVMVKAPNKFPQ